MSRVRGNRICFTVNNYSDGELQALRSFAESALASGKLVYGIIGKEVGVAGGTPHLQGFLHLGGGHREARTRGVRFYKGLPGLGRAHLESSKGSDRDNQRYCNKEGDAEEFGTPQESEGCVFAKLVDAIQKESIATVTNEFPEKCIKHFSNILAIRDALHEDVPLQAPEILRDWQVSGTYSIVKRIDCG